MSPLPFDLGLCEADERAMGAARREPLAVDREAALSLMADASVLVDAAVRRRPLLSGAPFTLTNREKSAV